MVLGNCVFFVKVAVISKGLTQTKPHLNESTTLTLKARGPRRAALDPGSPGPALRL